MLPCELSLPPVGSLLVALSGELVSAGGFHGNNLFIQFFIELPSGEEAGDRVGKHKYDEDEDEDEFKFIIRFIMYISEYIALLKTCSCFCKRYPLILS